MAKDKEAPRNGLAYAGKGTYRRATRPGGKDSTRVGQDYQRKTYVVDSSTVERIANYAKARGVGVGELVRWMLAEGMNALESGAWELPTETVERVRIASGKSV